MRLIRSSLLILLALGAGVSPSVIAAPGDVWVPKDQRTPAPKLEFSDIPGARRQFSQLKGKVIVVNFWATWCAPCKGEMPEFVKAYAAYRDRGYHFPVRALAADEAADLYSANLGSSCRATGFVGRWGITRLVSLWGRASALQTSAAEVGHYMV